MPNRTLEYNISSIQDALKGVRCLSRVKFLHNLQTSSSIALILLGTILIIEKISPSHSIPSYHPYIYIAILLSVPVLTFILSLFTIKISKGAVLFDLLFKNHERTQTSLFLLKGGMRGSIWLDTLSKSPQEQVIAGKRLRLKQIFTPFFAFSLLIFSIELMFYSIPIQTSPEIPAGPVDKKFSDEGMDIERFLDEVEEYAHVKGEKRLLDAIDNFKNRIEIIEKPLRLEVNNEKRGEYMAKEKEIVSSYGRLESRRNDNLKDLISRMIGDEIERNGEIAKLISSLNLDSSAPIINSSIISQELTSKVQDIFNKHIFHRSGGGKGNLYEKTKESATFQKSRATIEGAVQEALMASIDEFLHAFTQTIAKEIEEEIEKRLTDRKKGGSFIQSGSFNSRFEKIDYSRDGAVRDMNQSASPSLKLMKMTKGSVKSLNGKPATDGNLSCEGTEKGGYGAGKGSLVGSSDEVIGQGIPGLDSDGEVFEVRGILDRKKEEERLDLLERFSMERVVNSDFTNIVSDAEEGEIEMIKEEGLPSDYLRAVIGYFSSLKEEIVSPHNEVQDERDLIKE